jgi:hypothetical protein
MDNQKLQNLVERIARELLEQKTARKKVLFIFCDSSAHESFCDQFIDLKNNLIEYDLLFLDGETSAWLGLHQIQSTGAEQLIAADEYAKAPIELPKDYDAIVIPEIDIDNAARACSGLKGSVKAEIIFAALVLEKTIIIGEDTPGIKRSDRRTLKTLELPLALRKRFEKYKTELKEMGVIFANQAELHEKIKSLFLPTVEQESVGFQDKVLTTNWLTKNQSKSTTLIVAEGTIITPLAKDYIKEKKIKLIHRRGSGL